MVRKQPQLRRAFSFSVHPSKPGKVKQKRRGAKAMGNFSTLLPNVDQLDLQGFQWLCTWSLGVACYWRLSRTTLVFICRDQWLAPSCVPASCPDHQPFWRNAWATVPGALPSTVCHHLHVPIHGP